mmetsp:Transcript_30183/g.75644  ORF Transcript_30183/g.75644 Transcript_30183/m.75644 type:complete len:215 (+) Transcript_30183:800-1444(+)
MRRLICTAHLGILLSEPRSVQRLNLVLASDGVVLPELHVAPCEPKRTCPKGVVHETIEVASLAHVLRPHAEEFAHSDALWRLSPASGAEFFPKCRGYLARIVQAPAVYTKLFHPVCTHVQDVLLHPRVVEVELGQVGEVPPALIIHLMALNPVRHDRKGLGKIPVAVRRLLLRVQQRGERPMSPARVVEHTVQHQSHAPRVACIHQFAESRLAS